MENRNIPETGNLFPAEEYAGEMINFRKDRIFIWYKDAYCRIFHTEILCLEACRNYCYVYLKDQLKIIVVHPLLTIEKALPGDRFMRVHRSYLVNLEQVDRLLGNTIYIGKQEIPLGQPYRESFLARFNFLGSVKGLHK